MPNRTLTAVVRTMMFLACTLLFAACGHDDASFETEDAETPPENVEEVAQAVTHNCSPSNDTGYTNGKATPITLVNVQGMRVEIATADAYMAMADAAAAQGVTIRINSGFRTNAEQTYLYNCYRNCNCNSCNLAAAPGYSNHQSGHALDLNTASPGVAAWLNANGARFGFKRTVPSELWHWEWWGGGPGTAYCASCDRSAAGFTFSCDGPNAGKTCVNVNEAADKKSWSDNFVCTDTNIGLEWSMAGPLPGKRCVNVHESADEVAAAWADNFLCLPEDSEYVLEWSSAGPLPGKSCFNWNEPADLANSWGDNYLCVGKTGDFRSGIFTFSADGKNEGQVCVSVDEPADPKTWADNYICSDVDVGFKWSSAGPVAGMRCTNVSESAEHDPAIWADNFLCLPETSPYQLEWSTAGKIAGKSCVRWFEAADVGGSWADNYLCITDTSKGPAGDAAGAGPASTPGGAGGAAGAGGDGAGEASDAAGGEGCSVGSTPSRAGGAAWPLLAVAGALVLRKRRQQVRARA